MQYVQWLLYHKNLINLNFCNKFFFKDKKFWYLIYFILNRIKIFQYADIACKITKIFKKPYNLSIKIQKKLFEIINILKIRSFVLIIKNYELNINKFPWINKKLICAIKRKLEENKCNRVDKEVYPTFPNFREENIRKNIKIFFKTKIKFLFLFCSS